MGIYTLHPWRDYTDQHYVEQEYEPTFNYQHLSFIFNDYTVDEGGINACSWLVKFPDYNDMSKFQTVFLGLMYETLNRRKWGETEGARLFC